ncbi:MAG: hypothetical protein QM730_03995 [Anaerolineales bacterium]
MKPYTIFLVNIVIIFLSSCRLANSPEKFTIPPSDIGADVQKDKYLQVIAPEGWNTFKTSEPVSLMVRNVSQNPITFDPDLGARIFVYSEKEWIEVENKMIYENDLLTIDPSENWYADKTASTFVLPDLLDFSVQCNMRIFIIGDFNGEWASLKKGWLLYRS